MTFPDTTFTTGTTITSNWLNAVNDFCADQFNKDNSATNYLWAGEFGAWPMGHATTTSTTQRVQFPAGVTVARTNFTDTVTITHVPGSTRADALRIQRQESNSDTSSATVVLNLSSEETKPLRGKQCTLQFNGLKSSEYSGNSIFYRVQYSIEQEQPILNADGTYTNGNTNLVSSSVVLETTAQADTNPFNATFTVPSEAIQVSVVFTIPFSGTAGNADYVDLEAVSITLGSKLTVLEPIPFEDLLQKAATRYQSTYGYGVARGSAIQQGAVQAVAINTNTNWAFAINVDFSPKMALPPQFLFQSPTSGTESRLLDVNTGTNINGLAFNLNDSGVTITNNGAVTAGNRYLCHWTAQVIL